MFNEMHNYLNTISRKATIYWGTPVVYKYSVKHNIISTVCDHKGYYKLWELNITCITTIETVKKCVEVKSILNIKHYLWCVLYKKIWKNVDCSYPLFKISPQKQATGFRFYVTILSCQENARIFPIHNKLQPLPHCPNWCLPSHDGS